jgi:AraC-like DNA-binding protein
MKRYDYVDNQSSVLVEYTKKGHVTQSMIRPHVHKSYEIYYLLEGERYYFIHNTTYHVKKGMLVLIEPSVIHRTISSGRPEHERLLINIEEEELKRFASGFGTYDWFEGFVTNRPVISLDITKQSALREMMFTIYNWYRDNPIDNRQRIMLKIMEVLIFISDTQKEIDEKKEPKLEVEDPMFTRISQVVQYINEHYGEVMSLESLAKQFYFSSYYLSRNFKKTTGFNLKEYINQVRILEAEKKLAQENRPISEISREVGFESQTHFGRVFKQYKGISPSVYRKKIMS